MIVEYAGGKKLVARRRGLEVVSDQSEKGGGENTALTPTELFIASLAMCVAIFVVYFAERHDIPLEGMKVETDYEHAEKPHRIGAIRLQVTMPQPVAEQHRAALQRAAEQCVVHNTLRHPPKVFISLR